MKFKKINCLRSKTKKNKNIKRVPIPSSAPRPLGAAYVPILLSEVEQEQRPSGNGVGAGLCDCEGERAYTAYAPQFDIFAFREPFSKQEYIYISTLKAGTERRGHASMLPPGDGSEATEPYNKYGNLFKKI